MKIARALVNGSPLHGLLEGDRFRPIIGDPFAAKLQLRPTAIPVPDQLLSPVVPTNVLLIMGGFRTGEELAEYDYPDLVMKGLGEEPSGDYGQIGYPKLAGGSLVAVEAELAVVIGKASRCVATENAWQHIGGFAVMNDMTCHIMGEVAIKHAATLIGQEGGWGFAAMRISAGVFAAKSFDSFCSLGPYLVTDLTSEHIRDGLWIETRINGEVRGTGTTAKFRHTVEQVVSRATHLMSLKPGDVISLGTPGSVRVQVGDKVELEVEKVGTLHNTIVAGEISN
jgi:2-keto-4-pentenoate hydratase/2-oxohepta-3-ene-1,7-dioic acid hydratase in catechol pathway